ncbi:hypothetical protein LCGC14_1112370 [marine sediment metagenome]|uniref:Uncharacterized protein n=1 Tax=marine sediment metagenome TaxID=412755 RepID=A0A0F9QCG5_9ZZZZ
MAQLTEQAMDDLTAEIVKRLSSTRTVIPIGHQDVRAAVGVIDVEMNAAEVAILAAVDAPTRSWLTANQHIARRIVEAVEIKRREML